MKKILAVDDEELILELIKRYFENNGYRVDTSVSPDAALLKLGETKYDLILLDIIMPGKSGIDVLKLIKQHEVNNPIPVIMLSAREDMNSIRECLANGAADYITKPFEIASVLQRIKEYL